jgi:hypothetical protein
VDQALAVKTPAVRVPVCDVALFAAGVFEGASIELQVSPDELAENEDDMTWFTHPNGIFTDATDQPVALWSNADLAEVYIRAEVKNVTANTLLSFKMRPRVEMAI